MARSGSPVVKAALASAMREVVLRRMSPLATSLLPRAPEKRIMAKPATTASATTPATHATVRPFVRPDSALRTAPRSRVRLSVAARAVWSSRRVA